MNEMTLVEKEKQLAQSLAVLGDGQDRLGWLVEQARKRPLMDITRRIDPNRVEGCLARLWLVAETRDGRCYFQSESDSLIVKAVAGLLCDFYSGHRADEILAYPPNFLVELGIFRHLTPNRRNGLSRVWEKIRNFAQAEAIESALTAEQKPKS
jgi:cysteine desulfuration protein SufE